MYPLTLLKGSLIVPAHFLKRLHLRSTKFTDQIITLLEKIEAEPESKMALKLLPPPRFTLRDYFPNQRDFFLIYYSLGLGENDSPLFFTRRCSYLLSPLYSPKSLNHLNSLREYKNTMALHLLLTSEALLSWLLWSLWDLLRYFWLLVEPARHVCFYPFA